MYSLTLWKLTSLHGNTFQKDFNKFDVSKISKTQLWWGRSQSVLFFLLCQQSSLFWVWLMGFFFHFILEIQCWVTHMTEILKMSLFDFCRYFFKKRSNEFESEVVFEEISNDDEVLPLWDGKIVAKVDKMD